MTTPQQIVVTQPAPQMVVAQPVPQQYIVTQPVYPQQAAAPQVIQAQQPVYQPQVIQQQPAPQVQVGPAQLYDPALDPAAKKSEVMRRQRENAERSNEDLLQERLEQLRLRDEQRRLDQLFQGAQAPTGAPSAAPFSEQVVVAPVTERPGQPAPTGTPIGGTSLVNVQGAVGMEVDEEENTDISIQPRAGFSEMSGNVGYEVRPRISGGIGLGVATSDNVSFELGYTYTEYGVALASSNPYVQWAQGYNYTSTLESQAMKQNIFEAGMKLHFLGARARLRPFIGGGGAYSLSFINYDQSALTKLNQMPGAQGMTSDYELSSYLGYISTGVDLRVNKSISVGIVMKYYNVLSSRERSSINNAALYGAYPGYYNSVSYAGVAEAEKQFVAGSLAKVNFYSIMAGASFTF
ncbi:MAG: hypothetical protein NDJ89_09845 [Oligoflexia bacterium]|nr:hypothetical protein [Oligoflexia bacterium]